MIDYIEIKNFRCFKHTRIKNFGKVNLIGGLNNAGKTALLEALLLGFFPTTNSFNLLRKFRNDNTSNRELNENTWQYFFLNKSIEEKISIVLKEDAVDKYITEITCQQDFSNITTEVDTDRLLHLYREVANPFFLNVKGKQFDKDFDYFPIPRELRIMPSSVGKVPKDIDNSTPFLHSYIRKSEEEMTTLYTKVKAKKDIILAVLASIDDRIKDIEILTPNGKPNLFLSLDNQGDFPVNLFGDAIRKIIEVILVLLNTSNSVILIDEVENGLHYTKQAEFWRLLFGIAAKDTQIFATTHSKEMITAFAKTAEENPAVSATYFQMYRSGVSQNIVAAPYKVSELQYALTNNLPLRGEEQ